MSGNVFLTRKVSVQSFDKSMSFVVELKGEAEAEVVVAISGGIVVAIRNATISCRVIVATATIHAVRTFTKPYVAARIMHFFKNILL